jgi:glycerol uptake facilitator-like aquaporin
MSQDEQSNHSINVSFCLFCEFMGTFIVASGATLTKNVFSMLSVIFVAITTTKSISDAHLNPGVTFSRYIFKKLSNTLYKDPRDKLMIQYVICQCGGALTSFLLWYYITGEINDLKLAKGVSIESGFVLEFLGSFFLYYYIFFLNDVNTNWTKDSSLQTLSNVLAIGGCIAVAGSTSGAGLNPAIAYGNNMSKFFTTGDLSELTYFWIYIIAPILAAYSSALIFFYYMAPVYKYLYDNKLNNNIKRNVF